MAKAKAKKKAAEKKPVNKQTGKGKKATTKAKPGGPDIGLSSKLAILARHADGNPAFRRAASKKTEFQVEFKREKDKPNSAIKTLVLDDQEIGFVEGWIFLCENEFGGKYYDEKVEIAIKEALNGTTSGFSKLSG